MPRPWLVALALLPLIAAAPAHADSASKDRVAVGSFAITGDSLPDEVVARLKTSLRGGLSNGFEVISDAKVRDAIAAAGVVGCDIIQCLRQVGRLVDVPMIVVAKLNVAGTSNFSISLDLVDLAAGQPVITAPETCAPCTLQELNDTLSNTAASLRPKLEAKRAPADAHGPRLKAVSHPRYAARTRWIFRGLGMGLLAVGAAGVVYGAIDLSHNGDPVDANGRTGCGSRCTYHYDTTKYGGTFLGLGLASVVAGAGLAVAGFYGWHKIEMLPDVSPTSAKLLVGGRF